MMTEEAVRNLKAMFEDLDVRKIGNYDSIVGVLGLVLDEEPPSKKK